MDGGFHAMGAPLEALSSPRVLLAIDVGNTQTHLGMFSDDELVQHWRFATARFATADELATVLAALLGSARTSRLADVDAAIVSSVVPTLAHEYEQLIERYFDGHGRAGRPRAEDRHADPDRHARRSWAPTGS